MLQQRGQHGWPSHSPPHFDSAGWSQYHISAANYEDVAILGSSPERMTSFSIDLCNLFLEAGCKLYAWCVLPNHWHALVGNDDLKGALKRIGKLHGRCSFEWNGKDDARGRQCWHCCSDRRIRSERHFYAVQNYIHHNPVKHGYVKKWDEWVFSSAKDYLDTIGKGEALRLWIEHPVLRMGDRWDV